MKQSMFKTKAKKHSKRISPFLMLSPHFTIMRDGIYVSWFGGPLGTSPQLPPGSATSRL